jgi:hypothetical protein
MFAYGADISNSAGGGAAAPPAFGRGGVATGFDVIDFLTTPWGGREDFVYAFKCIWKCGLPGDGSIESVLAPLPLAGSTAASGVRGAGQLYSGASTMLARWPAWSFGNTGSALGITDKFGNITIRSGLFGRALAETLRHESVHSTLSPRAGGLIQTFRADLRMWGYQHSNLLRFAEEAIAEGYAVRSAQQGVAFAMRYYDVSYVGLAVETSFFLGTVFGPSIVVSE